MKSFLNVLGGVLVMIGVLGGIALFYELGAPGIDPAMRFGLAVGTALSCLVTAAILLGMAEGLKLLERIADGETETVRTAMPRQPAVRPPARTGGEVVEAIAGPRVRLDAGEEGTCPRCKASYRPGITICQGCGIALEGTEKER